MSFFEESHSYDFFKFTLPTTPRYILPPLMVFNEFRLLSVILRNFRLSVKLSLGSIIPKCFFTTFYPYMSLSVIFASYQIPKIGKP